MASQSGSTADRKLIDKVMWRVMPLCVLCLVISAIEKANIGYAKIGMRADLGFSEAVFGFGASLFYVGYILFEIPSAMGNYRYGARLWFSRIMVTWAITTVLLAFVETAWAFQLLRFLLGAAEAGLYPSLIFFLTLWFPAQDRARAMGYLTLGSAFGNGSSALLCGALLDLDGTLDLAGWQWVFLVTGLLPILSTVLVLRYLPSNPGEARFLDLNEKQRIAAMLSTSERKSEHGHGLALIFDLRVIGFGCAYAIILGSLYGINYWLPTVIHDFGVSGTLTGIIIGIPWAIDIVLLIWLMPRLRSARSIASALFLLALLGVISFGVAATLGGLWFKGAAAMLGIPALSLCLACFWTVPVRYFRGVDAAVAIGMISTLGNIGGVAALNLMPYIAERYGSPSFGLAVPSVAMLAVVVWAGILVRKDWAAR